MINRTQSTAAVKYSLGRWEVLTHYMQDGVFEIDNGAAKRALRAVALGHKNYLCVGSKTGNKRAAPRHSLIGRAKLKGHNGAALATPPGRFDWKLRPPISGAGLGASGPAGA